MRNYDLLKIQWLSSWGTESSPTIRIQSLSPPFSHPPEAFS
jgi:hypothetical protein